MTQIAEARGPLPLSTLFRENVQGTIGEVPVPPAGVRVIAELGQQYRGALFATQRHTEQLVRGITWEERAVGLKYILSSLKQTSITALAEEHVGDSPPENIPLESSERAANPFRKPVKKRIEEENVPKAGITMIAELGMNLRQTLIHIYRNEKALSQMGGSGQDNNLREQAEGLIFVLNTMGQGTVIDAVAKDVEKYIPPKKQPTAPEGGGV